MPFTPTPEYAMTIYAAIARIRAAEDTPEFPRLIESLLGGLRFGKGMNHRQILDVLQRHGVDAEEAEEWMSAV